jgi:methyl-accepting chemotaxis protein
MVNPTNVADSKQQQGSSISEAALSTPHSNDHLDERSRSTQPPMQSPVSPRANPLTVDQPSHSTERANLHHRLMVTALPTVLVPLAAANIMGYTVLQQHTANQVKEQLQDQALLASTGTAQALTATRQAVEMIATNPFVVDAAQDSSRRVQTDNLEQLSAKQLEQRFKDTKLVQPNQSLNDYLKRIASTTGMVDLSVTEQHGFNVAYSTPPSDVVQRDKAWWQQGQKYSQWVAAPERLEDGVGINISHALAKPGSDEFLGVVKAVLPINQLAEATGDVGQSDNPSQQLQLLNADTGQVITTLTAQGSSNSELIGGDAVKSLAAALVKALQEKSDPDQVVSAATANESLTGLTVTTMNRGNDRTLVAAFTQNNRQYTIATIPKTNWVAVASIDHSTHAVRNLLIPLLSFLLLGAAAAAILLRQSRRLAAPLNQLSDAAEQITAGNLDVVIPSGNTRETHALAHALNTVVLNRKELIDEQTIANQKVRLLTGLAGSRLLDERDLENVFNQTLQQARSLLQVDRLVVYRFTPDWHGYISNESTASGLPRTLHHTIEDACIPAELLEAYKHDRVVATQDVFSAGFHPDHLKLMERLQIKANLVVPILNDGQLFGLLIAHQCTKTHEWHESDVNFMRQLAIQLGAALDRVTLIQKREDEVRRSQRLQEIILQLTHTNTADEILAQLPVTQVRLALQADRVIVYRFDESWKGTIIAESVNSAFPQAIGAQIYDPCFEKKYVEKYQRGRVQAVSDIYQAGLTECHLKQLEPFAVKANLVAPILRGDQLLGLLIAHQCSRPRIWEKPEIDFFTQVAVQVGLALDRCDLLMQKEAVAEQARLLAQEQRQQKESLQYQLMQLLDDVEGAARGDLTVRADVSAGEIGTVADFFNSIVESLRQIVMQVKRSAHQVNASLNSSEESVRLLADSALKQAEDMLNNLDLVEQMTASIQVVAENARQATEIAHIASNTATTGEAAIDLSVQNILNLRETIGETAKKVKRLGESSQQISKVLSLINQFALQTNLLAINAGIEAARAGEDGQGFGVIAAEVGELAARSSRATQEIEKIIATIQFETSEVVEAMERSTAQVVEGSQLVEDTKESLAQLLQVSRQIDQLVQSISEATVSQVQISHVVSDVMKAMAQVSEQTSESSRTVSDSLRQTVAIGQELQASVETFKVN